MAFLYHEATRDIVHADDGGLIAQLAETVDWEDGKKMAAGPELFDALHAIMYANEIGELPMPQALVEYGQAALAKADVDA